MTDPHRQHAEQFLKLLDPSTDSFTFQTFDNTSEKNPRLTRIMNGTLEEFWDQLCMLNDQGAGVYVTVQDTDLGGRKKENITAIRGLFFENDDGIDPAVVPVKPTMVVKTSKGRGHMYYLLSNKVTLSKEIENQFSAMMEFLIKLGSDKAVKDIARVLRLPGFLNWKRDIPTRVELVQMKGYRYVWETLVEKLEGNKITVDDLPDFKAPKQPFLCAKIYSALRALDPNCDYDTWLRIGMAIHHASSGSNEGYKMFKTWSKLGANFNENDWPHKWTSFNQRTGRPVTVGTLYKLAKESGWDGQYQSEDPIAWHWIRQERYHVFSHMNRTHAMCRYGGGLKMVQKTLNEQDDYSLQFSDVKAMELWYDNKLIPTLVPSTAANREFNFKMLNVFTQWRKWEHRKQYMGMRFKPHKDIVIDQGDPEVLPDSEYLNTYLGLSNPGAEGDWSTIRTHIKEVWCKHDKDLYEYVTDWLAHMFQYPGTPGKTCLAIKSDRQGAGKNIIADILVKAFGPHGIALSTDRHITGNFNSLIAESIFTVLTEAVWSGHKDARSFLKSLITDPTVVSERKYADARQINNFTHLMCLSNEEWPVPVEAGDRRYCFLDCDNKYAGDHDYFEHLANKIKLGEGDAFIWYLRHKDIRGFNPAVMPADKSYTKFQAMRRSFTSLENYVYMSLQAGSFVDISDDFSALTDPPTNDTKLEHRIRDMYAAYKKVHDEQQYSRGTLHTDIWFGRMLKKILGPTSFSKHQVNATESVPQYNVYRFESIESLRERFSEHARTPIPWETLG